MNVRLTPDALQDLESIDSYISPENPEAATVTIRNIYE
ncbi:MAG TPA: type II toxin-antitoxin system RelE/ParE family toxin [Bryobacteraceae bacterium]|jgi:plasmid stabilization system protein ParE|nr:type II toxin-antitoxin system RelE/ParE family toxin [Bryobacteraceae bacterium]